MPVAEQARSQQGYVLLELLLATLIAGLLVVWGGQALVNRFNDAQAQAAAVWMGAIHKAVMVYVQQHGVRIQNAAGNDALAAVGYADWASPTVSELAEAGLLSTGFPETHRLTGAARVAVWRKGDCPGDACAVEAFVHGAEPLRQPGRDTADEAMVAQWLLAAEGKGAAVHAGDPARIRGAALALANLLPDGKVLPVGTVGMAITAEHLALWSYLRVGDTRNPDFQGQVSVAGDVKSAGDIGLEGQLVIGASSYDGLPCSPEGAVAHNAAGGLLVCSDDFWRSSSRTGGGGYGYNSLYGCETIDGLPTGNPMTGDCSCPSYATAVRIFDTGPRDDPEGRQQAYLCIG